MSKYKQKDNIMFIFNTVMVDLGNLGWQEGMKGIKLSKTLKYFKKSFDIYNYYGFYNKNKRSYWQIDTNKSDKQIFWT